MNKHQSPLIALSIYNANDKYHYFPADYIKAVRVAGGVPLLLPPDEVNLEQTVQSLDGIILTGGGDINPARYDGVDHPSIYWVNDEQDKSEFRLAEIALKLEKPILATCRGMQIINILLGGTLHAHLPDLYDKQVAHRLAEDKAAEHQVNLLENSRLANFIGAANFTVLSWHHQSIDKLAPGFEVVGVAQDGVVEAIESDAYPNLIAVQWHPEISANTDVVQQNLFNQWVNVCKDEHNQAVSSG